MSEKPPLPGPAPEQEDPTRDDNPRIEGRGFHIELGQEPQTHDTRVSLKPGANEADVVGEIRPKKDEAPPIPVEPEEDDFEEDEPTRETEVPKEFRDREDWFEPNQDTIIAGGEESDYAAPPKNHSSSPPMEMPRMNIPSEQAGTEEKKVEVVDLELDENLEELTDMAGVVNKDAKLEAIEAKAAVIAKKMLRKHGDDVGAALQELEAEKGTGNPVYNQLIEKAIESLKH